MPYDDATSRHWAEISAYRLQRGRPIACGDAWIAALSLRHNLPLLSHNRDDFADIPGLVLLTPSQPDAP